MRTMRAFTIVAVLITSWSQGSGLGMEMVCLEAERVCDVGVGSTGSVG